MIVAEDVEGEALARLVVNNLRGIVPIDARGAYRLSFRLPQEIAAWMFGSQSTTARALAVKREFFSNISIYRHEADRVLSKNSIGASAGAGEASTILSG
jgi:hypothetical protein